MTFAEKYISPIHAFLSRSRLITVLAIKIRNQCNLIITKRFGIKSMLPHLNGEYLVLDKIMPHCRIFFDVGANKGNWTEHILNSSSGDELECYLYEPGKTAYQMLTSRFSNNQNLHCFPVAVSDTVGNINFFEQENAGELSSAIDNWGYGNISTIQVATTTIDEEIKKAGLSYLDFLKIDTEGFDMKVLEGAINVIRENKVGFIQFEYNSAWALIGSRLLNAYKILEDNGYKVFLIQPKGLYYYDVKRYGEYYVFSNFLAVSPEKIQHVKDIIKGRA